ncbi:MAG: hypothetical protein ACT4QB_01425 [Gammaproteobacteria bacterium]
MTPTRPGPLFSGPGSQTPGWNKQAEGAALMTLAATQIEAALSEAEHSVCALGTTFLRIANAIEAIAGRPVLTSDGGSGLPHGPTPAMLSDDIRRAVVALQFHDRLTQKLSHVAANLGAVAELLRDPSRRDARTAWEVLRREIRARYTMDCERSLADGVLPDDSAPQIRVAAQRDPMMLAPGEGGAIDLF